MTPAFAIRPRETSGEQLLRLARLAEYLTDLEVNRSMNWQLWEIRMRQTSENLLKAAMEGLV